MARKRRRKESRYYVMYSYFASSFYAHSAKVKGIVGIWNAQSPAVIVNTAADLLRYVIKPNQNKSCIFGDISACLKWINLLMFLLVRAFVSN